MRALISEHEVHKVPVTWALLLTLLALTAARRTLITLEFPKQSTTAGAPAIMGWV